MGLVVTYYMPADATSGPWTEDLSSAVRLGTIAGIIDEAELGAVGISSLLFDDVDGTLGTSHYSDGIRGLKRMWVDETSCPAGDQRLWTGWIGDRHYQRGTDSLRTGVARKLDVTLVDANTMLSFRVFAPVNGSNSNAYNASNSFIRPAETDLQRVTALLAVPFLTSVHDIGFIDTTGGVDMDAVDYTGQHPADVLNDCAQASGRNFFIRYDETANEFALHYHKPEEPIDDSMLQISNVLADVDNVWTFAPEPDAELVRDPSRVSAAVYLPFNGSNSPAYKTRIQTEYDYGWRDSSAPSSNVKTLAKANVRATRYLNDNSTEDDRITCTVKLPANKVTGIKQGQRVQAKFSHLPNGSNATWGNAYQWCRVLNRNVMANELTNEKYNVRLELSPIAGRCAGATPSGTWWPIGHNGPDPNDAYSDATGNLMYFKPLLYPPEGATPYYHGELSFAIYGAGGPGTYDEPGTQVLNEIIFAATGPGTATYMLTGSRHLTATMYHWPTPGIRINDATWTFLASDGVTFNFPDTPDQCEYMATVLDNLEEDNSIKYYFWGVNWVATP
jgi:hypothetical protein